MSFASSRARARLLWLLAAVTAAYALVNVVVYYSTGTFGAAWFATSLVVYGVLLVVALALAMTDQGAESIAHAPPEAGRLLAREVLYATKAGYLLRLTYLRAEGEREARLLLCDAGASTPLSDSEAWVDALPAAKAAQDLAAQADAVLAARAAPHPAPHPAPVPKVMS